MGPALFFYIDNVFFIHGCSISDGKPYGDFINYPHGHYSVWAKKYQQKYNVDFDYYPRGRVVYRKTDDTYLIYYDKCMSPFIEKVTKKYIGKKVEISYDEHYQCHKCNKNYAM